ncbi:lipid-A-disaccharide synthase [Helicobacter mesocricetorum]|uniref:lipid-A-disaccharide synthase n=1 Tax=Helicobacter mesocricetorum TaxID=87012 RepID=UPI000CF09E49|nr:lipid-A-disaccharide synthase [Helicobacter mesocricetorum]
MEAKPLKIFVCALEYSSNLHLSSLIKTLKQRQVSFTLEGVFDSLQSGYKSLFSVEEFRVMGFIGVVKLLPKYLKIRQVLLQKARECDIAIFMDSSSFNIPIIQSLVKKPHKPYMVYYILPQVWAWKAYRAKTLAKICDELWGILPFEKAYYPTQANLFYVGHPLLDSIPFSYTSKRTTNLIAFMPGSRVTEIRALLPVFKEIAVTLKTQNKQALLIIPKYFKEQVKKIYGDVEEFILSFDTYEGLRDCEFAFVCSGTATLETTLLGIPTLLVYKAKTIDFLLAKSLVKLNYIGLANIFLEFLFFHSPKNNPNIYNFPIIPEILQQNVKPHHLLREWKNFDYEKFFSQKEILMQYLKNGSAENCARKIEDFAKNLLK